MRQLGAEGRWGGLPQAHGRGGVKRRGREEGTQRNVSDVDSARSTPGFKAKDEGRVALRVVQSHFAVSGSRHGCEFSAALREEGVCVELHVAHATPQVFDLVVLSRAEFGLDGGELLKRLVEEVDGEHERVGFYAGAHGPVEEAEGIASVGAQGKDVMLLEASQPAVLVLGEGLQRHSLPAARLQEPHAPGRHVVRYRTLQQHRASIAGLRHKVGSDLPALVGASLALKLQDVHGD